MVQEDMVSSWTFFWLAGGEVGGSQHHQPSGPEWSGQQTALWGVQYLQNSSAVMYPL